MRLWYGVLKTKLLRVLTIDSAKQKIGIQMQLCNSQLNANQTPLSFINNLTKKNNAPLHDKVQTD